MKLINCVSGMSVEIEAWKAIGMPNGRNVEHIFGRNGDRAKFCPISGGENEGAEMKACPWKNQVPLDFTQAVRTRRPCTQNQNYGHGGNNYGRGYGYA